MNDADPTIYLVAASLALTITIVLARVVERWGWINWAALRKKTTENAQGIVALAAIAAGLAWPPLTKAVAAATGALSVIAFGLLWMFFVARHIGAESRREKLISWEVLAATLAALAVIVHPHSFARGIDFLSHP